MTYLLRKYSVFILITILIIGCKNRSQKNILTKEKFNHVVNLSIESLKKDTFFGIKEFEKIYVAKDSVVNSVLGNDSSISCYYSRYYANVNFYNTKTTLSIDLFGAKENSNIQYLYDHDDNDMDLKLENRYMRLIINKILYRITLGNDFDQAAIYLLNIKIRLLQSYISSSGI